MDYDLLFNMTIGVTLTLFAFIMKHVFWGTLQKHTDVHEELHERIAILEKLVAGEYVKRSEFRDVINKFDAKLDKIVDKLGEKQDR